MAGIGFLGAGGIIKEGFSVRGADDRGLNLGDCDDRHTDRHRILFSGRREHRAHPGGLTLSRWLEKRMRNEQEALDPQAPIRHNSGVAVVRVEVVAQNGRLAPFYSLCARQN
jgi:hypothetical protein